MYTKCEITDMYTKYEITDMYTKYEITDMYTSCIIFRCQHDPGKSFARVMYEYTTMCLLYIAKLQARMSQMSPSVGDKLEDNLRR